MTVYLATKVGFFPLFNFSMVLVRVTLWNQTPGFAQWLLFTTSGGLNTLVDFFGLRFLVNKMKILYGNR